MPMIRRENILRQRFPWELKFFGFSDHVPCPYQDGYVSNIRMTMKQAPEYVETIRRLEAEYRDQIKIYVGFEAEYVPEFYEEQMRMFRNLDVII